MFEFGIMSVISASMGTIGFLVVIIFLLMFDKFVHMLDDLKLNYSAAYEMIQTVFKELMIMGVVNFIIIMIDSSASVNGTEKSWMIALDYAHICFFFCALFYVLHAGFLILLSVYIAKKNILFNAYTTKQIISDINKHNKIPSRMHKYFMLQELYDKVSFKIQYYIFRENYNIPMTFDYASYLNYCLVDYIIDILDLKFTTRVSLLFIVLLNYIRLLILEANKSYFSDNYGVCFDKIQG
jgi:hypothetical protein